MWRLPNIIAEDSAYSLPLSARTAIRLAEALLADDDRQRIDLFSTALKEDPFLALWVVWNIGSCSSSEAPAPSSIKDLADWLSQCALLALDRREEVDSASDQCSQYLNKRWTDIVYRSILVARKADELAAGDDGAEAAYLLGLLHDTRRILDTAKVENAAERVTARLTVDADIVPFAVPDNSSQAAGLVEKAIRLANRSFTNPAAGNDSHSRHAWKSARAWQEEIPGAVNILRHLVRLLVKQAAWQDEFADAVEGEKLAAMKEFAYGAGHEINNPLANISTRAQTLLRDETDVERRRKLATINAQAFRAHEMIADLMLFAKPPRMEIRQVNVIGVIDQVISEIAPLAESQGTSIARDGADTPITVETDPEHLAVALKAIGDNALEALGVGGTIRLTVNQFSHKSTDWAEIAVTDTGPGITPEVRRHLFDPFFSGREAGRGLGFGLCKCWRVVTDHGGTIQVDSEIGEGSTFRLRLPIKSPLSRSSRAA